MADLSKYPKSEHGNYAVVDTIGVPHPYCIGARHVAHASDRFGGMLGKEAIESAERNGIHCQTCKGQLSFKQHEKALLVKCDGPLTVEDGKAAPELHAYLLSIKGQCEADGYVGFAFLEGKANG